MQLHQLAIVNVVCYYLYAVAIASYIAMCDHYNFFKNHIFMYSYNHHEVIQDS